MSVRVDAGVDGRWVCVQGVPIAHQQMANWFDGTVCTPISYHITTRVCAAHWVPSVWMYGGWHDSKRTPRYGVRRCDS